MRKLKTEKEQLSLPRIIFLAIVTFMYYLSGICLIIGIWIVLMIAITDSATIESSRHIAIGIILFYPIRYLKNYLGKNE